MNRFVAGRGRDTSWFVQALPRSIVSSVGSSSAFNMRLEVPVCVIPTVVGKR